MFKNNRSHVITQICHLLPNTLAQWIFAIFCQHLKSMNLSPANNPVCTKKLVFLRTGQVQTYIVEIKIGVSLFFTNLRMSFVFLSVKIKSELISLHA